MDCVDHSDPGYIVCPCFFALIYPFDRLIQKPENIFESSFLITLLAPLVDALQGSCHDYGKPKGAVALGAAAVSLWFHRAHLC